MRPALSAATIFLSVVVAASQSLAQEARTVAVVSLGSYDDIVKNAKLVGGIVGFPNIDQMLEQQIAGLTGGKGLAGVDKTKPVAMVLQMAGGEPYPIICIPVTDLQQALGALPGQMGLTEDAGDGIKSMPNAPDQVYLKEGDGWAYFGRTKENLAAVPANPQELVGDLATKYLMSAKLMVQNIPAEMRTEALGFLQSLSQQGLASGALDDEEVRLQQNVLDRQLERLKRLSAETDEVVIGLGASENDQSIFLDFAMTAVAGSATAKEYSRIAKTTSNHAGLADASAAMTALATVKGPRGPEEIAILEAQHKEAKSRAMNHIDSDGGIPPDVKEEIKGALGDLLDVAFDTLKSDTFDAGMAFFAGEKSTVVVGGHVSDGDRVEAAIKKLMKIVEKEENVPPIAWDAENHGGYRIHTASMPTPDPAAAQFLGNEIQIAMGMSAESCYVAAGGDAIAQLKKTIDASAAAKAQQVDPFRMVVRLAPMAAMAAPQDPTGMAQKMAQQLQEKGNIIISASGIENGVQGRLEIEPNVLKAVGQLVPMIMQGLGGGGGAAPGAEAF